MCKSINPRLKKVVTGCYFQKVTPSTLATYTPHDENFPRLTTGWVALEFGAGLGLREEVDRRIAPDWAETELARAVVNAEFSHYSREEPLTPSGHFVLRAD